MSRLNEFKLFEFSDLIWGFTSAGAQAPSLFVAAAEKVRPFLGKFQPGELAMMLWGFAHSEQNLTDLFRRDHS